MIAVLVAVAGATGVGLLYSAVALESQPRPARPDRRHRGREWLAQAGLAEVSPREFTAVLATLFLAGAILAYALFGGVVPALAAGVFSGALPVTSYRARRGRRRAQAHEAWPRLIEEIRIQTGSLGRSLPQALFEVGRRAPADLRPAFSAAQREWILTTNFEHTIATLKYLLADATADATLETLLVAHEVGGTDIDRRLAALVEDRIQDVQGRKDARAQQAGVRFARRFVLLVPLGMATAGLSIGEGRAAYETAEGQLAVAFGIVCIAGCWAWAGRLLALPEEQRVFSGPGRLS